jgi:hypothetical protein
MKSRKSCAPVPAMSCRSRERNFHGVIDPKRKGGFAHNDTLVRYMMNAW